MVGTRSDADGKTDAGSVYVLFINNAGMALDYQKISMLGGGFTETLNAGHFFGTLTFLKHFEQSTLS